MMSSTVDSELKPLEKMIKLRTKLELIEPRTRSNLEQHKYSSGESRDGHAHHTSPRHRSNSSTGVGAVIGVGGILVRHDLEAGKRCRSIVGHAAVPGAENCQDWSDLVHLSEVPFVGVVALDVLAENNRKGRTNHGRVG